MQAGPLGRKPRIRSVLLAVNLVLLALPLGGFAMLRLYESALVQQTETELIAQAAVLAAAYRSAWAGPQGSAPVAGDWAPRPARLDLARDAVLPAPPPAQPPPAPAEPRAVLAGAALQPVLVEARRSTLAAMRLLDRNGVVVASSGEEMGLSLAAQEEVAAALAGQPASGLRQRPERSRVRPSSISRSATLRVFVAQPVWQDGVVVGAVLLSRTPPTLDQALWPKRWELAGLLAALLAAAGLLALFTAYTVSRPIQAVAAQARAVAAGARVPLLRTRRAAVREADELWQAIQTMAGTLERRADYIGAFAAEVSHEFKTPLTGLRGALELLQDHAEAMSAEERARFLRQAAGDVERLERLVRRLLELARAEAPAPRGAEHCDIAEVAREAVATSGLAVTVEGAPTQAAIGAEALRAVLANLLDNVRQHAGPGAQVRIGWVAENGRIRLDFRDDGGGISAGNAPRVFDRFFTTAREAGGTGLGLAIARSRLEAAGGGITLLPAAKGAHFVVSIPAL